MLLISGRRFATKVLEPWLIVVGTTVPRGVFPDGKTRSCAVLRDTIHSHFLAEVDINRMHRRADRSSTMDADDRGRFITRRGIVSSFVRLLSPANDRAFIAAGYRSPAKCSLRSQNVAAAESND